MKIISRGQRPVPFWKGPWKCYKCQSVLDPESESEIWSEDAQYTNVEYFAYCPVCECRSCIHRVPEPYDARRHESMYP